MVESKDRAKDRRCPECLTHVSWAAEGEEGPRKLMKCQDDKCSWGGRYYDTIPIRVRAESTGARASIVKSMVKVMDFEVAGRRAIQDAENHSLSSSYADPDPEGNEKAMSYIQRLGYIVFLKDLLSMTDIDESHKIMIINKEIDNLFSGVRRVSE